VKYLIEIIEFIINTIKDIFLAIIQKVNIYYFILVMFIIGYLSFDQVQALFDALMASFSYPVGDE
jgi:hypothetical protein